jgi:hypothetical protein
MFEDHFQAVVTVGRLGGKSYQSKLYYRTEVGGVPSIEDMATVGDAIHQTFAANWRSTIPPEITLFPTGVRYYGVNSDVEGQSTEAAAVGGALSANDTQDVMPEQNVVVIQRRTGMRGRNFRGRIFLPFVMERWAVDSTLTPQAMAVFKALATKLSNRVAVPGYGDLFPCTPDFKTQTLPAITECRVVSEVLSRRDRRDPKRPVVFAAVKEY